jgi:hypothetical protein
MALKALKIEVLKNFQTRTKKVKKNENVNLELI